MDQSRLDPTGCSIAEPTTTAAAMGAATTMAESLLPDHHISPLHTQSGNKTPNSSYSNHSNATGQTSSWLLRLFESDFFDARLALSYLHKHSDSVGIHHYICDALRKFPDNDIEFLLPQLCHMAITRPSQSVALESFLEDLCRSSQHMAILMLWLLDAYLKDMQLHNLQNASFRLCQRLYHTCQTIVFDDTPAPSGSSATHSSARSSRCHAAPYEETSSTNTKNSTGSDGSVNGKSELVQINSIAQVGEALPMSNSNSQTGQTHTPSDPSSTVDLQNTMTTTLGRKIPMGTSSGRIFSHIPPSIVGMGVILAGFGNPGIFKASSRMILTESRYPRTIDTLQDPDALAGYTSTPLSDDEDDNARTALRAPLPVPGSFLPGFMNLKLVSRIPTSSPSLDELSKGSAFSFTNFVRKTTEIVSASFSGQSEVQSPVAINGSSPKKYPVIDMGSLSLPPPSPGIAGGLHSTRRSSAVSTDSSQTALALREQSHLLSSHYFHSQIQFTMTLIDISDRLRAVPKSARQSMLVAELTLLNHNLPADVCIPFWCPADSVHSTHHRVVRVSPSDAVVLNSADRVPYLMMIEVVSTEHRVMSRRVILQIQNVQEDGNIYPRDPLRVSIDSGADQNLSPDAPLSLNASSAEYYREVLDRRRSISLISKQQPVILRQLINGSSPTGDTPASSSSSSQATDTLSPACSTSLPNSLNINATDSISVQTQPLTAETPRSTSLSQQSGLMAVTGDEFSERMRTAAVMLAQLYQQQQKELLAQTTPRSIAHATPLSRPLAVHSGTTTPSSPHTTLQNTSSAQSTGTPLHLPPLSNAPLPWDRPRAPSASSYDQSTPTVGSPRIVGSSNASTATDRRMYNKLRNDFEEIRGRVIKEMMMLEQQRMESLSMQLGLTQPAPLGTGSSSSSSSSTMSDHASTTRTPVHTVAGKRYEVVVGADDILPAQHEQRLYADSRKKNSDDPSASVFREPWSIKKERIRSASPFGRHPNWDLISVIVKSGADLRQEKLALQLISEMQHIWVENNVAVWVYSFRMLITSEQSGLIETIRDAISVHSIKKEGYARQLNQQGIAYTLYDYFVKEFGQPGCDNFQRAQDNFMRSLAGYSLICYLLQIKDRHNGNILLDLDGHCTHIDFGFMLTNSPGSVGFELAPFKLPQEYLDILGGIRSNKFAEFRALIKEAFLALRKSADSVLCLVEIMEKDSLLPCFTGITPKPSANSAPSTMSSVQGHGGMGLGLMPGSGSGAAAAAASMGPLGTTTAAGGTTINHSSSGQAHPGAKYPVTDALRERFQLSMTETQIGEFVDKLIDSSCNNMFTKLYDSFQYYANGIL
ncbi:hypothetical protein BASA60_003469 [Batrachochytrium salamandrivorans]|nr:hypothetical protein BASA60_003469 [Batrachochytrium salamandrivorans]KAH9264796.1 hypothetical protein BASA83_011696 [Batrachochytrium salamandrivorans]